MEIEQKIYDALMRHAHKSGRNLVNEYDQLIYYRWQIREIVKEVAKVVE